MTATSIAPRAPRQGAFIFVFITVVLDMVALGVTVPVLPKLIIQFKGGDAAAAAIVYGGFASVWAAMQFVFAPLLGALSDRFGRRPIILASNFGLGLDYILMALAPTLPWLLVGRIISGITAASYPTAAAYISDVTPVTERAAKFGMLGAAFGIGFTLGPGLGGWLSTFDLRLPFWVAAGLSLANWLYGYFILPESLPRERRARVNWRKANPIGALTLLRSHPELFALAIATFVMALAHEALPNMFVLYTDYRYHWSTVTVTWALVAVGVCSGIVQGGLTGPAVKRFGERLCLLVGLWFGIVGFVLMGGASTGAAFATGIPLIALWGLANPAMQSLMSQHVQPSEHGQLQGA
ncbi:MAG TPA: TCR/Tet family MFS transporter, partial [Steroidobacteraceae bacterium]|nr:TCR/Tet family MFS transporter [Steroidobacteraceae bacterium]